MANPPTHDQGNQSSLYEKLAPDQRQKLDRAIVDRQPATLQACYQAFNLASLGISRAAFYRYARRLRQQAELHHVAGLVHPDDPDPARYFPQLVSRRLVELLLYDDQAPILSIHRLMNAVVKAKRG